MSRGMSRAPGGRFALVVPLALLALWMGGSVAGCSSARRGIHHTVHPGENLYRIGKAYGVPFTRLAKVNRLADPSRIIAGQRLFIPGADRQLPVNVITPREASLKPVVVEKRRRRGPSPFIWPLQGDGVTSRFGPRGRSFHDGIDIAAAAGTKIVAAGDGVVAYADKLRGYGRVIILRHNDGYATVYAHNRENLVREGQNVRKGKVIATVGESGRTTGPNLHFEVRRQNVARDPLQYLPPPQVLVARKSRQQ